MEHILGFIGYGEAARHIAAGLRKEGMKEAITAFDVLLSNPERKAEVLERMGQAEVIPKASAVEVAVGTKFIVSVNSAKVAYSIAQEVIPALQAGQVYVELNSASPDLMEKIDQIPRAEGVLFCDGAALGNVQKFGHKVPICLAGSGADAFAEAMMPCGMNLSVLDAPAGAASAMKMLRSVVSKGMQQLMLEFTIAAETYGILPEMMQIVNDKFKDITLEEYAEEAFPRILLHSNRRIFEVAEVVETIESAGLDASMSRAACERFKRLDALGLADIVREKRDLSYQEIVRLIIEHGGGKQ